MIKLNAGSKYFRYKNKTDLEKFRILEIIESDDDTIKYLTLALDDGSTKIISSDEAQGFVEVLPDAKLDLMITQYEDPTKKDVYIWVYRMSSIQDYDGHPSPQIMLRQDVYSYSKNAFGTANNVQWVGECLTDLTNPMHTSLMSLAEFHKVEFNYTISIYVDDTLSDIIQCIPQSVMDKVNNVLEGLTKYNSDMIQGYCSTLKQLMEDNNFIANYRSIFNVTQVHFEINEPDNKDDDITLSEDSHHQLEDLLRKHITNTRVIRYDQDIDLSSIVNTSHVLISDKQERIYLISYDIVDDYPIDDDIMKAFGLQSSSIQDMEAELGIKLS